MDLGLQAKILRVLQEREVERLGSTRTIESRRATDRDIQPRLAGGGARRALPRRPLLPPERHVACGLPALRERRGDILPLARRAIQACARGTPAPCPCPLRPSVELVEHDWPGNARELTNIVQRAAWLASGGRIDATDLDLQALAPGRAPVPMSAALAVAAPAAVDSAAVHEVGLGKDLKERERELILATLRVTGGSRKLAAERLGISPRTLRHKLQQLKAAGVTVPRLHNEEFAAV